jgi:hypothetical protein
MTTMATTGHTVFIAGNLTAADWASARDSLTTHGTPDDWKALFDTYFQQRLELRYLNPIKTLQQNDRYAGEGFTIAAIQCTLIEFLAAARLGKTYRYGQPETVEYYSNSSKMFINFLATESPFNRFFDAVSAKAFYENVRCGLLHEAQTKGGWTVRAGNGANVGVDPTGKVVYRNNLQSAIQEYLVRYREEVCNASTLQQAFIRKFNKVVE